eukprot:3235590-Rhodomonas_salina.2
MSLIRVAPRCLSLGSPHVRVTLKTHTAIAIFRALGSPHTVLASLSKPRRDTRSQATPHTRVRVKHTPCSFLVPAQAHTLLLTSTWARTPYSSLVPGHISVRETPLFPPPRTPIAHLSTERPRRGVRSSIAYGSTARDPYARLVPRTTIPCLSTQA